MKKLGVYAGSFNPFHLGHADILFKARKVFDEVILAVGKNTGKNDEIVEPVIGDKCNGAKVIHFNGLLTDFLNELELSTEAKIFLIRGLRNGNDLEYEDNQLQFLKEMYPSLEVVFFRCDTKYKHISSSALRALKKVSETEYKKYLAI